MEHTRTINDLAGFLLDERSASIIAVILAAVLSYVFAKKHENKKHNVEIFMFQLQKVFLPLYLEVFDKKIDEINFQTLFHNMNRKRRKYFLYLSLDFYKIEKQLEREIEQGNITISTKKRCKNYIIYEYMRLKRILGFSCKIEEYFFPYLRYNFFKNSIYFSNLLLLYSITILSIFGGELYYNNIHFYDVLSFIIGIVFVINILLIFFAVLYYIYIRFNNRKI